MIVPSLYLPGSKIPSYCEKKMFQLAIGNKRYYDYKSKSDLIITNFN